MKRTKKIDKQVAIVLKKLELKESSDPESDHVDADECLLDFLSSIGFDDVSKAYKDFRKAVGFWYA